jgi:hypothetical protein
MDRLDDDKVPQRAKNRADNAKPLTELTKCIDETSTMDLWDVAKCLFFGNQYVNKEVRGASIERYEKGNFSQAR